MTKDTFSGVLTFALLIGGTVAVGSAMLGVDGPSHAASTAMVAPTAQAAIVTLPTVAIVGRRADFAVAHADSAARLME